MRDISVIKTIGRQMSKKKLVMEAYLDAVKDCYGYLFLNCCPCCDEKACVRAKIFESFSKELMFQQRLNST